MKIWKGKFLKFLKNLRWDPSLHLGLASILVEVEDKKKFIYNVDSIYKIFSPLDYSNSLQLQLGSSAHPSYALMRDFYRSDWKLSLQFMVAEGVPSIKMHHCLMWGPLWVQRVYVGHTYVHIPTQIFLVGSADVQIIIGPLTPQHELILKALQFL